MDITFFETIRSIPGTAAKVAYAREHHTQLEDQIVADAMDPAITYGITSKDIVVGPQLRDSHWMGSAYGGFHSLLRQLAARKLTGNAAIEAIADYLKYWDEPTRVLMKQVLDRDLKIGISWKTWRAEVMGITEKFEVALAQHLKKATNVNPTDGTYFASRKCDGLRCVAIVNLEEKTVEFRSRQNKVFTTLDNLKPAASRFCKNLMQGIWVLDGELCKIDKDGNEDFKSIMSEYRRKNYSITDCCYQVFDILTYDEFCQGITEDVFHERLERLLALNAEYAQLPHEDCWIKPLRQERITSQAAFERWERYVELGNWEGFMLRKDTVYHSGRTKDLLKVKKFEDAEFVVEGIETGTMTTSMPGAGNVEYQGVTRLLITHKGNRVGVGAGLSREQRIAWMENPKLIVGKTVTIKFFEETTNKDGKFSLRFPTLKCVYEEGRDV